MLTLKELYSKFEAFQCKGKCQRYCGLVPFSEEEARAAGEEIKYRSDLSCQFLTGLGTCRIYENRPFMCRAFGAVDTPLLKCPHGCSPTLTDLEGKELTHLYNQLMNGEQQTQENSVPR